MLYAALLVAAAGVLLAGPTSAMVAAVASAATIGLTAAVAGPLHVRLGGDRDETLLRRLTHVDRVRTLLALVDGLTAPGQEQQHGD